MISSTILSIAFGLVGGFLAHRALPSLPAMGKAFVDRGPKRDRCPECGGTDYFNGYGTCQMCDAI